MPRRAPAKKPLQEPTHFLNVDLDIAGRARAMGPLFQVLEARLICVSTYPVRGLRRASYESRRAASSVEATLRAMLDVIERLDPGGRRAWEAARVRDFNVGLQAGRVPHATEFAVTPATLARIAALEARLVITVYAPFPRPRR
jgi:hypothetical protein